MARPNKIWFRKSTGWWVVTIDGTWFKLAKGRDNKQTAQKKFNQLIFERDANPPVDGGDPTIASLIDQYLVIKRPLLGARTFDEKLRYLQHFADEHGLKKAREVKGFHLEAWVRSHPNWKSAETRADAIKQVKAAFNWSAKMGLIDRSPFAAVAAGGGRVRRRPATNQEVRDLIIALAPRIALPESARKSRRRLREIVVFCLLTGARPCEVRSLLWSNVSLEDSIVRMSEHKTSRTQRIPRPREIVLVPQVVRMLNKIKLRGDNDCFVFVSTKGHPWHRNSLSQALKRIRKIAGLKSDLVLYGLRHRFATQACLNDVSLPILAQMMGHTTTRMTERYINLAGATDHLRASAMRAVRRSESGRRIHGA